MAKHPEFAQKIERRRFMLRLRNEQVLRGGSFSGGNIW
jgi:hypothetical protein